MSRKVLILIVSIFVGFLLAEAGLRLFGWADVVLFTSDPKFSYLMTPSQKVYSYGHPVVINSLGLRGDELQQPKPAEIKRILFIGDSITYGGGRIREDQVFCQVVRSLAERDGIKVEVVNLSAPGWAPKNWLAYVDERGLHEADIVVLVLPECDLARPMMSMDQVGHESDGSYFRLTNVSQKVWNSFRARTFKSDMTIGQVAAQNSLVIGELRDRIGDVPFLTVLIPTHQFDHEEYWPSFEPLLTEQLDLREPLQDSSMFLDGVHLSAAGHRFVGEQIFDQLRDELNQSDTTGPE